MKRMSLWVYALCATSLVLCSSAARSQEFCVSNALGFQDALWKAVGNGEDDVIKVVQGTYSGYDLSFNSSEGHNLEVLGGYTAACAGRSLDPANTILDGQNVRRTLVLINSGGGDIKVEGFTIRNGFVKGDADGGGLYVQSSSSTKSGNIIVRKNVVTGSSADHEGGGIFAHSDANPSGTAGNVSITHNVITGNKAKGDEYASGGGVHAVSYSFEGKSGKVVVSNNAVTGNTSNFGAGVYALSYGPKGSGDVILSDNAVTKNTGGNGDGGGIYAGSHAVSSNSGAVTVTRNAILHNTTAGTSNLGLGGGLYAYTSCAESGNSGKITVTGNRIQGNRGGFGAGVYAVSSALTGLSGELAFTGNWVSGNRAESGGGGIVAMSYSASGTAADIVLVNNLLAGNDPGALENGGGLWARSYTGTGKVGHMTLTHNTVTGNRGNLGGGVYLDLDGNTVDIFNNIVRGNSPPWKRDLYVSGTGTLNVWHNDYSGGNPGLPGGGGNIDQDPLFLSPGHWNDQGTPADPSDDLWVEGDYHLQTSSPCIDKGENAAPKLPATDTDGNPRKVGAKVDMGAYEHDACFPISLALDISILCAQVAGSTYGFTLNYFQNAADPANLYWKLNPATLNNVSAGSPCVNVPQNLSLSLSCAEFVATKYAFTLDLYNNPKDPAGYYWKMDWTTLKKK